MSATDFTTAFAVPTALIGGSTLVLLLLFVIPHMAAAMAAEYGAPGTLALSLYSRSRVALLLGVSGLCLTATTAGLFNDAGYYQRTDGNEYNYARWVALSVVFMAYTAAACMYLGMPRLPSWSALLFAVASTFCFTVTGLSTMPCIVYWFTMGCITGTVAYLHKWFFRAEGRNRLWPDTVFLIFWFLAFAFLIVTLGISTDAMHWISLIKSHELYGASTSSVALLLAFFTYFTFESSIPYYQTMEDGKTA